jgi:hypothetical protein
MHQILTPAMVEASVGNSFRRCSTAAKSFAVAVKSNQFDDAAQVQRIKT